MRQSQSNFKEFIINFPKNVVNLFKSIPHGLRWFFGKKTWVASLFFCLSITFSSATSMILSAFTKTGLIQSISEELYNQQNSTKNNCLGMVYPYETYKDSFVLAPIEPNLSSRARSIDYNFFCLDAYPADFMESSPAVLEINGEINNFSFLLMPKNGYMDSSFSSPYNIHLLAGGTNKTANTEDIYLNKKYADYLIENNIDFDNYDNLLDHEISIPYKTKYNTKPVPMMYRIKGVLDDNDELYIKYQNYLGDFFVTNQYLSLPVKWVTLFSLSHSIRTIRNEVELLTKTYNYDYILKRFNALESGYPYEYRIYAIDKLEGNGNLNNYGSETSTEHFGKIDKMYNFFFTRSNYVPFAVMTVLSVIALISSVLFLIYVIKKNDEHLRSSMIKRGEVMFSASLLTLACFAISLLLSKIIGIVAIKNTLLLSINSWLGILLSILIIVTALVSIGISLLRYLMRFSA